jgi:protein PET117
VHYFQRAEKEVNLPLQCPLQAHTELTDREQLMHSGVIRDEERMRIKRERQLDFEMQKELEQEYKKSQRVSPVNEASTGDSDEKSKGPLKGS